MEQGVGKRAGDVPGLQAELWQRLSVAGVRRSGRIPAEQRLGGAGSSARQSDASAGLVYGDGDCGARWGAGRSRGCLKEAPGISACALGMEGRRKSRPRISAWLLHERRAREEEDGADVWARHVSGRKGDARVAEACWSWAAGRVEWAEWGKKGAGPRRAALGPVQVREGEGKGWAACGLGWADWFLVSFSFSFSISFSFSFSNTLKTI